MSNNNSVISGFFWRFLERSGAQGVALIVSIILARVLDPVAYGTIALITVFTGILQVFVDSGLGTALIQKKDADDLDFSTVFYFNVAMSIVLYLIMFFSAPYIATFYNRPELTALVRVLSLYLVIAGLNNIQQSYVSRHMLFKRFFYATLVGTVLGAVLGIWMAYHGYGAWSLVAQQLANITISAAVLWITVKWHPKFMFSFNRLKQLFSFGYKLLLSSIIDKVYLQLRQLIIGKMYNADSLAYYNKGSQFPEVIVTNINSSINSVLLPVMSKSQDDREVVKNMLRRSIRVSTYLIAPLLMGFAAVSENFIIILLTKTWLPALPYLCIFCVIFMFYPIHTANLNAINAMGRSDIFLKLEIIKKAIGISVLLSTMWFGPLVMAYSLLFSTVLSQIINAWPNKKLLNYSILDQWKDIAPSVLLAAMMGGVVWLLGHFLHLPLILELLIQMAVGGAIYIGCSALFKMESFTYVLYTIKNFRNKNKS